MTHGGWWYRTRIFEWGECWKLAAFWMRVLSEHFGYRGLGHSELWYRMGKTFGKPLSMRCTYFRQIRRRRLYFMEYHWGYSHANTALTDCLQSCRIIIIYRNHLSTSDSQSSSPSSVSVLVPFHAPLTANAVIYWVDSNLREWGSFDHGELHHHN